MPFVFVAWLTVPVTGLRSLLATAMGATCSACQKRWLLSVHAISTWPAVCAGPACVQHASARPDSQFLCCTCVCFLCDILWPEVQSHSDDSHIHVRNWSTFCFCLHFWVIRMGSHGTFMLRRLGPTVLVATALSNWALLVCYATCVNGPSRNSDRPEVQ